MQKLFKVSIVVATVISSSVLIFSFFAPFFPLADSVAHFRLYIISGLGLLTGIVFLCRSFKVAAVSLVTVLLGLVSIGPYMFNWQSLGIGKERTDLKLMQINVLYNNRTPEKIIAAIRKHKPDIVTLQEVQERRQHIIKKLKSTYPYQIVCRFGVFSNVILSRFPAEPQSDENCAHKKRRKGLVWVRLKIGKRTVSLATLHLHWPYPFGQRQQIDALQSALKNIPRPLIVTGDFNAAPWSYAVHRIEAASDTNVIGGLRLTWIGYFPFSGQLQVPLALPIDHILLPSDMVAHKIIRGPFVGSDHRPVIAEIMFLSEVH